VWTTYRRNPSRASGPSSALGPYRALCRPLSYVGLIFTHGLRGPFLRLWSCTLALRLPFYLLGYLLLRLTMAYVVGVWGVGDEILRRKLYLVPLRDAANFAIWLASFASNRITLGRSEFTMEQGHMVAVGALGSTASPNAEPPAPVTR